MKNVTYYNASAGSGKTYTLTHKLAELIKARKVRPEQVIMTTFTVKAANEIKEETKKVLYEEGLFEEATRLDQAMIGTIHSVANSLIKKYWFFLGLSPDMGVMAEEDTKFYISQSLADLPKHDELKLLHYFCESAEIQHHFLSDKTGLNYDFWKEDIENIIAFTTNYEIENYDRSIDESLSFIRQFVRPTSLFDYSTEELKAVIDEHILYAEGQRTSGKQQNVIKELNRLKRGVSSPSISWFKRLKNMLESWRNCGPLGTKMLSELQQMWHSQMVYNEQEQYIRLLFTLAERWKERFYSFKKERNLLDYNDMEKYLRDLLKHKELAYEVSMDYRYLFVDEYQDCSPIQVKIFDRLSELMEHSYWVGDYKQAIYGFRGSDITLTKAVVDQISKGADGCDIKTLDTSYRSLPDIVDVCNKTFKQTFANVLSEDAIVLKANRKNEEDIKSVRFWNMEDSDGPGIISHIINLIQQGVKPSDIAVLGRTNDRLNLIAKALTEFHGIPANREDLPISEMKATNFIFALLSIIASNKDSLAKSQIALLTVDGFDTKKILEEKLLFADSHNSDDTDFLNDVPLVSRLLKLRPMLLQQSVSSLVETMVIELDLYNEIKKLGSVKESTSCLNTIIQSAYAYEQHCLQMNLPSSINGFIDYLVIMNPVGKGDANGVQLHTYHSSKGLQWKYVILTQLYEKKNDPPKCVKQNIFGIHFNYTEKPSVSNPYPEVYIRVIPFIYGASNTKVPEDIEQTIEQSPVFKQVSQETLSEANRLLYVGMTRPQDVLILALEPHPRYANVLQWFEDIGLENVYNSTGSNGRINPDILGVGFKFENDTLNNEQFILTDGYQYYNEKVGMFTRRIPYNKEVLEADRKYISPSSLRKKGVVKESHKICERMPLGPLDGKSITDVGNCIHHIFCGIEQHIESETYYTDLVESFGLSSCLTDHMAIRNSWKQLIDWLTENYGTAIKVYHERPFSLLKDGQVYTGSIDLVWQTAEGDIIIDFKTCPMGQKEILNTDSEHYAGWYAGQLDAYTYALEEAGEKVIKRFIYYPVSGLLAEVERVFDWKPPYRENVFHIFGIDGLDIKDLWKDAPNFCSDDGFSGQISVSDNENESSGVEHYSTLLCGASTQGVGVTYIHDKGCHLHIELPWLASVGDVKLAFAFMKTLRKLYPDCGIFLDDNTDEQFALVDENYDAMVVMRLINMREIVENPLDGHMGANGFSREFIAPTTKDYPDLEIEDLVFKAANIFVELQWEYADFETAGLAHVTPPDGDEYTMRILSNAADTFVGISQHVCLSCNSEIKDVPIEDFFSVAEGNPNFKMVDAAQFILRKMPDDEWKALYDSLDVEPIRRPKTFLLRWNPNISSFTFDQYRQVVDEHPEGFGFDWSIYEWEQAHKNDHFYMLRTGDEHAGIVFWGTFTSEPYEGDDWAGQGKVRHYMDMDCYDCIPADQTSPISLEVLEQAIPEIDWRKGHSGELLSEEVAEKLDKLWNKLMIQ
jgi:superfamily I DNA/RNA helicase